MLRCLLGVMLMFGFIGFVGAQVKPDKLYTVKFENTSWKDVIDWLEKESGLMCITKEKPQGSITLKSDKKYTLGDLFDLLNERAEQGNFTIIRKSQSFSFYLADQKLPDSMPPTVTLEDLASRGKSEYVQCLISLKDIKADEVRVQIKKMLSPFGDVQSFGKEQLLVRDKAAYVRNVLMVLDAKVSECSTQYNHKCIYKRASYVAETLRTLLKDNATETSATATSLRRLYITVDDATNSLQVTGPADKIIAAIDLVKELDRGNKLRPSLSIPIETNTVTVQPVAMSCLQPVIVTCQPVQRFHLFPLRKCR